MCLIYKVGNQTVTDEKGTFTVKENIKRQEMHLSPEDNCTVKHTHTLK